MAWKWYSTLRHPKIHSHTKFGTPTSNNVRDMLRSQLFKKRDQGQGQSDPKKVCDTLTPQDASTHKIWNFYLKYCRRYATDTIILEMRSYVKVTVTQNENEILSNPMILPHTKKWFLTKNVGDMLRTQLFMK